MSLPSPPPISASHALFLDFDGTLAPLQDDANAVHLTDAQGTNLCELADQLDGALALISGRDVRDLAARTPEQLLRIGNHGLYRLSPNKTLVPPLDELPSALRTSLETVVSGHEGVFLEIKGPVGTVHFRANPDAGPRLIDAVRTQAASQPGYRCKVGNHVVEAIPDAANKGAALELTMKEPPFEGRIPVMVGDDTTDEDGFRAAQRLGGFGIKVGNGDTGARKRLADVDAVWDWLRTSG